MVNDLLIETDNLLTNSEVVKVNIYKEKSNYHQPAVKNSIIQRPKTLLTSNKQSSSSSSFASVQRNQFNDDDAVDESKSNVGNLSWKFFDQISILDYQLRDGDNYDDDDNSNDHQNDFNDNDDEETGKLSNLDGDAGSNSREVLLSKSNPQYSTKPYITKLSTLAAVTENKRLTKLSSPVATSNDNGDAIMSLSGGCSPSGSSVDGGSRAAAAQPSTSSINRPKLKNLSENHNNTNNNTSNLRNDMMNSGGGGGSSSTGSSSDNNKIASGSTSGKKLTNNNNTSINQNLSTNTPNKNINNSQYNHNNHVKTVTTTGNVCGGGGGGNDGNSMPQYGIGFHLGLFGWRKKCLYTLILVLMLLILVNLVLTLWILKVMEFSSEGMGQLKIVPGGIQLTGQALIMDLLRASTIRSKHGQPITLESSRNFSINTRDSQGILENQLFLGHDKLECLATSFRINDTSGRTLFAVNRDEVTIGAHSLRVDGEGGAIFRESIQTPHVRADAGRELRLESPTRQLEMTAAKDITLQSRAGGVDLTALDDVKLTASDGSIRLESSKIFLPNLKTAQLLSSGTVQTSHTHRVYQLCACSNGKLFLASPHSICADGDDSTVCR